MSKNIEKAGRSDSGRLKSQLIFTGIFIAAIIVVFFVFNVITNGKFLDFQNNMMNMRIILASIVYPTFISWGICFIFACGYNDMSWGSVVVLASFGTGVFGNAYGFGAALVAGVLVGTILIFFNFCVFAFAKIPSWIASISLAMVYEAIGLFLRVSTATGSLVESPLKVELRTLGHLPWSFIILVVGFIVVYFLYERTTIGFNIRAIGGNARVASSLGVNLGKTLLRVGLICGLLVGVASFLQQSYNGYTTVKSGLASIQLILQPLAIALLAEILRKKINIIIAVPICAFLMFAAFNILTLMHLPSGTLQEALLALLLIAFAVIGQRGVKGVVK